MIILASSSPRRIQLLHRAGLQFTAMPVDVDESAVACDANGNVLLSEQCKLNAALHLCAEKRVEWTAIIAADTMVYANGTLLGKPSNRQEAFEMLTGLQNSWFEVHTGFCVAFLDGRVERDSRVTRVRLKPLTAQEINQYIQTGEPLDKAGALGIQGLGGKFIRCIEGDYFNVVGLPVAAVMDALRRGGVL